MPPKPSSVSAQPLLLNVDDNAVGLYAKTRMLRHAGFEVIEATTGAEALKLVEERLPALLILDVKLPDISGLEVCRRVKQSHPHILVLQISASFVDGNDRVRGLEGGADSYLTQPVAPNELAASVRALLRIRAAEAALRASEAHLQGVLASVTDYAIISIDEDDLISGWNAGAVAVFGWQAGEALGRKFELIFTQEDRKDGIPAKELERARQCGRSEDKRWHARKDGSQFFASGVVTRLDQAPAGGFVKILRDQTEQKQSEEAQQQLNLELERRVAERTRDLEEANALLRREMQERLRTEEQLRQSQKMEVVGQLTGGVAHDFNNLLQIITGNIETILRNLPEDASRLRRAGENAMMGAHRAATLTQRLLAFSRRQPLAPRSIDVNQLISGMPDLLKRALGETLELEIALADDIWLTEADPTQLESAILNLAVNARDAMPDGGKLTLTSANKHLEAAQVQQNFEIAPGQYVVVAVSDTGTGMDRETLLRAFEPFFTTKEVGKGTGLGLSMVYGFVRQSGGHVILHSELGLGTTVEIYLPRLWGAIQKNDDVDTGAAPEGSRTETILVVEDDDDVRAYSVEILRELGYRVLEAHDSASALRLLERAEDGAVSLLFTDVVLRGGISGEQLAAQARELCPNLKVLFTTGYAGDSIIPLTRPDPRIQLIGKPFAYADLAHKVRDVLKTSV